jgi:hypothetical protein
MVVLKSLSTFLQCALSSPGTLGPNTSTDSARPSIPTYYLIPSFTNVEAYENFDRVLQPLLTSTTSQVCRSWNEDADSNTHHEDFVDDYELLRDLGSSWSPEQLLHVASSYAGVDGSPSKSASAVTVRIIDWFWLEGGIHTAPVSIWHTPYTRLLCRHSSTLLQSCSLLGWSLQKRSSRSCCRLRKSCAVSTMQFCKGHLRCVEAVCEVLTRD